MPTCQCIKKDGKQCTYPSKPRSPYCGVHKNCKNKVRAQAGPGPRPAKQPSEETRAKIAARAAANRRRREFAKEKADRAAAIEKMSLVEFLQFVQKEHDDLLGPEERHSLYLPFDEAPEPVRAQYEEWVRAAHAWVEEKPVVIVGYGQKEHRHMSHYLIAELRAAGVPKHLQFFALGHMMHVARSILSARGPRGLGKGGAKLQHYTPEEIDEMLSVDFNQLHKDLRPPGA